MSNPFEPYPKKLEPKIMIGVHEFWKFVHGQKEVRPGIYQIDTVFGPVFGGEDRQFSVPPPDKSFCVCSPVVNTNPISAVESDISRFWSLEGIGIDDQPESNDDQRALEMFKKSVRIDEENRYEVSWPWKKEGEIPPTNFSLAYSRISGLLPRLRASSQLLDGYNEIIQDQLQRKIIEPAQKNGEEGEHFLPHHPVMGKKLRIVFDASSHTKGTKSLNDCLLPGPNLYPDLDGTLIKFRATPYPVSADVEKAFLMIGLYEKDREFTKFIWFKDPQKPLTGSNVLFYRFLGLP